MKKYVYILPLLILGLTAEAQELLNYPLDTVNGEEVYRYQVEKSIGLYRIGVNFNVTQSEIVRLNPQLRERGLHYGELLLIPTGRAVSATPPSNANANANANTSASANANANANANTNASASAAPIEQPAVTDSLKAVDSTMIQSVAAIDTTTNAIDTTANVNANADTIIDTRRIVELALMLPFESHQTVRNANAERMMEFYQGALLALKEVQNDSTLYRLRVYDTERSERKVAALCDSTELDSVRGIVGPVYPIQIARMSQWCLAHRVPLILPFSDDEEMGANPYLLQFNSTDRQEADSLCRWISDRDSLVHCVAIDVREAELAASMRILRRQLTANNLSYSKVALRDVVSDSAAYALDSTKENLIILHSDKWQHARIVLPHLLALRDAGFRIRLVSQYSWQKEAIGLPQIYTSVFTAWADRSEYDREWGVFYKNEHISDSPRYDLLGHDLMRALIALLQNEMSVSGLQSDIRWQQTSTFGGWQNANVQVIEK